MDTVNIKASLLETVQDILQESTAPEAQNFDAEAWLDRWLERPQPSLGGLRPSDILDSPSGQSAVKRLLGAISSGAYQ